MGRDVSGSRAQGVMLFLAATVLFSAPGVLMGAERTLFWQRADLVDGTVRRVTEPVRHHRNRSRRTPTADIAYRVAGQDHLQPMAAVSVFSGALTVGQHVTVLVDPFDPKRMYPYSVASVFGWPFVLTAVPLLVGLSLAGAAAFGPLPGDRRR
jgi:hypothetical protein